MTASQLGRARTLDYRGEWLRWGEIYCMDNNVRQERTHPPVTDSAQQQLTNHPHDHTTIHMTPVTRLHPIHHYDHSCSPLRATGHYCSGAVG